MYHYRAMPKVRVPLALVLTLASASGYAQVKTALPPLVGATELAKIVPPAGFIDDAIGGDDQHLAYVLSDAATKAELHVVRLDDPKHETIVDLATVTLHPIALPYVADDVAFVVGQNEDGSQTGALVPLAGKRGAVYKLGPATSVSVIVRDGKSVVAVARAAEADGGSSHKAEVYDLRSGRRLAAGNALVLDAKGSAKTLEFSVNHWAAGGTLAIGIKGGEWDKKENQRSPDTEATYDLVTNRFVDRKPIDDLFEQRKRYQVLAAEHDKLDFVRMSWDNTAVQIWRAGKPTTATLDQPIASYDPKSLQGVLASDGTGWIALKIDPVNPDAVARKKADPEYLDVFRVDREGKAVRRARVLATGVHHRFGVLHDRFWLLERSPSFERGGRNLAAYQLQ
jgi:hypothetical protein